MLEFNVRGGSATRIKQAHRGVSFVHPAQSEVATCVGAQSRRAPASWRPLRLRHELQGSSMTCSEGSTTDTLHTTATSAPIPLLVSKIVPSSLQITTSATAHQCCAGVTSSSHDSHPRKRCRSCLSVPLFCPPLAQEPTTTASTLCFRPAVFPTSEHDIHREYFTEQGHLHAAFLMCITFAEFNKD